MEMYAPFSPLHIVLFLSILRFRFVFVIYIPHLKNIRKENAKKKEKELENLSLSQKIWKMYAEHYDNVHIFQFVT